MLDESITADDGLGLLEDDRTVEAVGGGGMAGGGGGGGGVRACFLGVDFLMLLLLLPPRGVDELLLFSPAA